jgi:hypothetical protein
MPLPLYSSDLGLVDHIEPSRALRLERAGLAKVIRHKGHINRAVFYRRVNDPLPPNLRCYAGQVYSFEQPLGDGHFCWRLRPLQGGYAETTLAPPEVRPIFLRVLLDCLAGAR